MVRKFIVVAFMSLAIVMGNANAYQNGDVIGFEPGQIICLLSGTPPNCDFEPSTVTGSWFALEVMPGFFFKTAISPGPDGGILIGTLQPAFGSHTAPPDGSESPGVDQPWSFFYNTGMHQIIDIPVTENLDGTLDFRGWGVTWNTLPNIPLGSGSGVNSGKAVISCLGGPCQPGDIQNLDYYATIPPADPSGFGGVNYHLHLENINSQPTAKISIELPGGYNQQCSTTGGSNVAMNANIVIPDDDSVLSVDWTLDGVPIASGEFINELVLLGSHVINATVTTVNGLIASSVAQIIIKDTMPPVISADFINRITRMSQHVLGRFNLLEIEAAATDVCDANPTVEAMIGGVVDDGDFIFIMKYFGNVSINLSSIDLTVRASDASNNSASETISVQIN